MIILKKPKAETPWVFCFARLASRFGLVGFLLLAPLFVAITSAQEPEPTLPLPSPENQPKTLETPPALVGSAAVMTAARAAFSRNDTNLAMGLLEVLLSKFERAQEIPEAKTKLGWCLFISPSPANYARAEALWNDVAAAEPKTEWGLECRWHLVQLAAGPRNNPREATKMCLAISKDVPAGSFRHEQALFSRAWLFWTKQQWAESQQAFKQLIEAYPAKANHPPIVKYLTDCELGLADTQAK